jgi:hypothetical protein
MDDLAKFALFLAAVYGAYKSARTALRLAAELLG